MNIYYISGYIFVKSVQVNIGNRNNTIFKYLCKKY